MIWLTLSKVLYSLVLVAVLGLAGRELIRTWFNSAVYMGAFTLSAVDDPKKSAETFPALVVNAQALLTRRIEDYQRLADPDGPSDGTFSVALTDTLELPAQSKEELEIKLQGVNVTAFAAALRRRFTQPNEIRGHITYAGGSYAAAVDWPKAPWPKAVPAPPEVYGPSLPNPPDPPADTQPLTEFYAPGQTSLQHLATYVACSVMWARGAASSAALSKMGQAYFCDYAMALTTYYSLRETAGRAPGLNEAQVEEVRRRIKGLSHHDERAQEYPNLYRLRADLIDLLPAGVRSNSDIARAQEDRLDYLVLGRDFDGKTEAQKRALALALARPAILETNGTLKSIPGNWRNLLSLHIENIERGLRSTGVVMGKPIAVYGLEHADDAGRIPTGTAFLVANNLAITARHVLHALDIKETGPVDQRADLVIRFASTGKSQGETMAVKHVHYIGGTLETDIALLELQGHRTLDHPPLPLVPEDFDRQSAVGRYVFVVGYPFRDMRLPPEFLLALLGERLGERRVMPGRALAVDPATGAYTSDTSTTGGTSGGPLIDLFTGQVLGISYAGRWHNNDRGKFAFAQPLPHEVRKMIARRLAGHHDLRVKDAPGPKVPVHFQ